MTAQEIIDGLNDYIEHPTYMVDLDLLSETVKKLEAVEALKGLEFPDNATNGDVMKAVFPNLFINFRVCDSVFMHSKEGGHLVDLVGRLEQDWWDSPYKGVSV